MSNDLWFEEDILPTSSTIEQVATHFKGVEQPSTRTPLNKIQGQVRLHTPRWTQLKDTKKILTSGASSVFYQVRLGFEIEVSKDARDEGAQFEFALCSAQLWSAAPSQQQPSVYEIYPAYLDEGKAREIAVEFGPSVKVGEVSGSLGKIGSDVQIGQIEPVIVGWKGDKEREPHWELRPQSKSLIGVRHLWMLVQVPEECQGARLAVQVEGDIQTHWGVLPVGPKERLWDKRPSILIR